MQAEAHLELDQALPPTQATGISSGNQHRQGGDHLKVTPPYCGYKRDNYGSIACFVGVDEDSELNGLVKIRHLSETPILGFEKGLTISALASMECYLGYLGTCL
ncbi:MAG: hypothetical protein HYY22_08685 [Thaumarchaeota archaeon]|nr:hypothetical protein [Nitrososphaerota archaeon]